MADIKRTGYEMPHYTEHDLQAMDKDKLVWAYCLIQNRFERLRDHDYPDLEERYRILTVRTFGRSSEKSRIVGGAKPKETDRDLDSDGKDEPNKKDPWNDTNGGGNGKKGGKHPVRSKGCSSKVTDGLPVIDEDIELTRMNWHRYSAQE